MTLRKFAGLGALLPRKSLGRASGASRATFLPAATGTGLCSVPLFGECAVPKQPERQRSVQRPSPGGGMHPQFGFAR